MDLICYLHPGWDPLIRPAEPTRDWMDRTPEAFAYRCLPLNIANAHGWEILSPCAFDAWWTGGALARDVVVRTDGPGDQAPVALFGQGVLTFHIQGLFRTPPGWDLFVGGSPNRPKDGIAPLSGVVETDWSPYTFTMNWKFTRRNHRIRFEKHEPFCFVFPVKRGALEQMDPKFVALTEGSDLVAQFRAWSASRDAFQAEMADGKPRAPAEKWQKRYYRGVTMRDDAPFPDHRSKLRLRPFVHATPASVAAPIAEAAASNARTDARFDEDWLADVLTGVARGLRGDRRREAVAGALIHAGVPGAMADRLAASVARAMADEDDQAGGLA